MPEFDAVRRETGEVARHERVRRAGLESQPKAAFSRARRPLLVSTAAYCHRPFGPAPTLQFCMLVAENPEISAFRALKEEEPPPTAAPAAGADRSASAAEPRNPPAAAGAAVEHQKSIFSMTLCGCSDESAADAPSSVPPMPLPSSRSHVTLAFAVPNSDAQVAITS